MDGVGKIYLNIVRDKLGKVTRVIREIGFRRPAFEKIR
jgi:hypothetical protein